MASFDDSRNDTPGEDGNDSGYLEIVGAPTIRPLSENSSSINTEDALRKELNKYKTLNVQLRDQIHRMNRNVLISEKKLWKVKSNKEDEQLKKDIKIQEAREKMEVLSKRNTELLMKIKEYENSIKILESNEKKLLDKLAAFRDKETEQLLLSESRKTETTENELLDLKQRIQDMTKTLEEKDKTIAINLFEQSKFNEKLEENTNEVKAMNERLKENTKTVNNMEEMMKDVLSKVEALGSDPTGQTRDNTTGAETSRSVQQVPDTSRSLGRNSALPPISKGRPKGQEKPPWNHSRAPKKN